MHVASVWPSVASRKIRPGCWGILGFIPILQTSQAVVFTSPGTQAKELYSFLSLSLSLYVYIYIYIYAAILGKHL